MPKSELYGVKNIFVLFHMTHIKSRTQLFFFDDVMIIFNFSLKTVDSGVSGLSARAHFPITAGLPDFSGRTTGKGALAITRLAPPVVAALLRIDKFHQLACRVRLILNFYIFNPSVPDAPNWQISAFEKRFRETERS